MTPEQEREAYETWFAALTFDDLGSDSMEWAAWKARAALHAEQDKAREDWLARGLVLMELTRSVSVFFKLGAWWADRPWRKRPPAPKV